MHDRNHLLRIQQFADTALVTYDLDAEGWTFAWDRAKRRFGCCNFANKRISISIHLARINDLDACKDTVLHEIAHALAGREAGHGPRWIAACKRVGARPDRCYSHAELATPPARYIRYCPSCFQSRPLYRKSKKKYACGSCCRTFNKGLFSERFLLQTVDRSTFESLLRPPGAPSKR